MARKFYYDVDGEKLGPVSGQELLYLRAEGRIGAKTWVRAENSQTWRPFDSLDLSEERRKAATTGLWRHLFRNISPSIMLIMGLVLLVFMVLLVVALQFLWPILLVVAAIVLAYRIIRKR